MKSRVCFPKLQPLGNFKEALALREAAFEKPMADPQVWEPVICARTGTHFRLAAAAVSTFEIFDLFRCSNAGRYRQMGTKPMGNAGEDGTQGDRLMLEKKRIANIKSRLEDQSIQLSRLAILTNQQRISHVDIAKNLVLAVQSIDLELRELGGIEVGLLR